MFAVAIVSPPGQGRAAWPRPRPRAGLCLCGHRRHLPHHCPACAAPGVDPRRPAVEALLPAIQVGWSTRRRARVMRLNGRTSLPHPHARGLYGHLGLLRPFRRCVPPAVNCSGIWRKRTTCSWTAGTSARWCCHAQLKVFLTASAQERARRRVRQLEESGQAADYEAILRDIQQRDYQDSHREVAPLRPAEDAVLVDTSQDSFARSVERLVGLVRERL